MALQSTFIKTEVSGIEASVIINRFDNLEKQLSELSNNFKPKEPTELLTRKEVASILGVTLPTLHSWTKQKILLAYRIGNKVRYKKNEVMEALQSIK